MSTNSQKKEVTATPETKKTAEEVMNKNIAKEEVTAKQVIIKKYGSIDNYINSTGIIGSNERLQTIANLDLGKRREAAKRVLERRNQRKDLMDKGFSFEDAVLIVNKNYD